MTEYSAEELRQLIGDKVPVGRSIPAAWWVTTDAGQLAAYDRWVTDYDARCDEIATFAESIGLKISDALMWTGWGKSELTGFNAPFGMTLWPGHEKHIPIPAGWRLDRKKGRLVPSRKTKSDRESQANKDLARLRKIPHLAAYLTGLPNEIEVQDRDFGGTIYSTQYRRGDQCVMAFSGADPERAGGPFTDKTEIDTAIWHRQKLSTLLALREEQEKEK